jgi:hypothetical protein
MRQVFEMNLSGKKIKMKESPPRFIVTGTSNGLRR